MSEQDWYDRAVKRALTGEPPPPPVIYRQPAQPPAPAAPPQAYPTRPVSPPEDRCPECGSGNYAARGAMAKRCFDCGHIEGRDFRNSTQGLSGDGPVKAAPGQQSGTYAPQQIVDRIG